MDNISLLAQMYMSLPDNLKDAFIGSVVEVGLIYELNRSKYKIALKKYLYSATGVQRILFKMLLKSKSEVFSRFMDTVFVKGVKYN